ncbi:Colicin I receptor precursor [Lacunisphaera limnophila]|uniref:Colicin I receptor n=1 Tax=Lacunisphaera limnophila TaxID=1838286 RepID=A0A1D8AV16_9BACT|nr:TonB-dependent receptor [Lacunisphaera limnophila]AOS44744.1 Colicin I receptor precursor [Lacunisphaera limnophila]
MAPPLTHAPKPSALSWMAISLASLVKAQAAEEVGPAGAPAILRDLSFEELATITVTTVSKRQEQYFNAAAAVHVITGEEIRRSGALMLPEVLRLAPGVEVGAINSRSYAVAIRGFNGTASNKLLPLIDGRSLYSQRFASTIWDIRDLPLEDVEQIEVIGGPGGTTWGANAVNGVINIITKSARDTQGSLWAATAGSFEEAQLYARQGFAAGRDGWARVYVKAFQRGESESVNVADNNDGWSQVRAGFRYDRERTAGDTFTVTGDLFTSDADQLIAGRADRAHSSGGHLLARHQRALEGGGQLRLQSYLDVIRRDSGGNVSKADLFDVDGLVTTPAEAAVTYSAGVNYRLSRLTDSVDGSSGTVSDFMPLERYFNQGGFFLEAAHRPPTASWHLAAGAKMEYNDFTSWEFMPSVRGTWMPNDDVTWWASWSRASRIPSRFENDQLLVVSAPGFQSRTFPSPALKSEILDATELGWRWRGRESLHVDASLFYHHYSRLVTARTLPAPGPSMFSQDLDNQGTGTSRGAEVRVVWRPRSWWQLQAAYTYLHLEVGVAPGSSDTNLEQVESLSPRQQLSLRSSWNIGPRWELDAWFRSIARLPQPGRVIPGYETLDFRVGHQLGDGWEVVLAGQNLLEPAHREFRFFTVQAAVARGFYLRIERRH